MSAPENITNKLAEVYLRVPIEMKARWVKASRQKGMKLTDWVVQKIEKETTPK